VKFYCKKGIQSKPGSFPAITEGVIYQGQILATPFINQGEPFKIFIYDDNERWEIYPVNYFRPAKDGDDE